MKRVTFLLFCTLSPFLGSFILGQRADPYYEGHEGTQKRLRNAVRTWTGSDIGLSSFNTGSPLFDGEWLFGTYVMAGLGEAQFAIEHNRSDHQVESAIDRILSDDVRAFQRRRTGYDPIDALEDDEAGDVAYLGYLGIVMGLSRLLNPDTRHSQMHDRICTSLSRRLSRGFVTTYPGEIYPVDNMAALAALSLHQKGTGTDHSEVIQRFTTLIRQKAIDPKTGLLIQNLSVLELQPGPARGSGTALATYFASFVDEVLAGELYEATKQHLARSYFGFGIVREYPVGVQGSGDIDSGPVVLGASVSATGFSLGATRAVLDHRRHKELFATASFWGIPSSSQERTEFIFGGPLGNAIMFAMLTTQPSSTWSQP